MAQFTGLLDQNGRKIYSAEPEVDPIAEPCQRAHKSIANAKRECLKVRATRRWEVMLRALDGVALAVCSQADIGNTADPRSFVTMMLTMEAAAVRKNSTGEWPQRLSDEGIKTYRRAADYVKHCCLCEILRREGLLEEFKPAPNVLTFETGDIINLSEEGKNQAWAFYGEQTGVNVDGVPENPSG